MMRCTEIAALLLSGSLLAQTFVVDAANGPGTNFTSIASAVAAVPDGATLVVRAGMYADFSVDGKGLTILCDPGVFVGYLSRVLYVVMIRNTTPSQTVTIRGMQVLWEGIDIGLCAGPVDLIDVSVGAEQGTTTGGFLTAGTCAQVQLKQCTIDYGCWFTNSTVTVTGSSITGLPCCQAITMTLYNQASEALHIAGSNVTLSGSQVRGGAGYSIWPPKSAILLQGGDVRIVDGTLQAAAGTPCITGGGTLRVDPSTVFATSPSYAGTLSPQVFAMPSLIATDSATPGTVTARLDDPVGDTAALLVGLPGAPIAVPGIADPFWINPGAYYFAAVGTAPISAAVTVPANPNLRGFVLAWQGVTFGVNGMQASNPNLSIVR